MTLGGGWIETEFDDLVVTPLEEDALKNTDVFVRSVEWISGKYMVI